MMFVNPVALGPEERQVSTTGSIHVSYQEHMMAQSCSPCDGPEEEEGELSSQYPPVTSLSATRRPSW